MQLEDRFQQSGFAITADPSKGCWNFTLEHQYAKFEISMATNWSFVSFIFFQSIKVKDGLEL